ncbi:MAG: ABC transporter permease [Coriobacteriales bacterium]|jgi:peptide/nickel transport system permease protein|nr:ABC transporter permease [Coriobacteriales bacterium]
MRTAEEVTWEGTLAQPKDRHIPSLPKFRIRATDVLLFGALLVVLFFVLCALFPGLLAPYSPTELMLDSVMAPPSAEHLFGTDHFGRDILSIVIYGSRVSILTGVVAVLLGGLTGGLLGALAGYVGGWLDAVVMRLIDILMTIPGILLALLIVAVLKPSFYNIVLAISISTIPSYARVMRSEALRIKELPFILASRSIGTSHVVIFLRHIVPNAVSSFLVIATIGLGSAILMAAGLSFLGLGVMDEIPDWGTLLSQGRGYLSTAWWICTFPGLFVTVYVLAINVIGDHLRDLLSPKLKQEG